MLVEVTNVTKRFETGGGHVTALHDIDLQFGGGEFVSVLGPSGSGKSTLLTLLGLLDTPSEGTVTFDGDVTETYSRRERTVTRKARIGFVFQEYGLIETLTATENVAAPGLLDPDPAATERRARQLLERVGLGDRLDHYPGELSGGQKQRVAVARSLINEPDIVLADEPTGNLDRDTGERVVSELLDAVDDDVPIVAVTHDEYVAGFSDRQVRIIDGELRSESDTHSSGEAEA
jgi:ABC-type antimicrobial peptide transport system, ATPase component